MSEIANRITIRINEVEQEKLKEVQDKAKIGISQIVRQSILDMKPLFICETHRKEKAAKQKANSLNTPRCGLRCCRPRR